MTEDSAATLRIRRRGKTFKDVSIDNTCLGEAEMLWVQQQAENWTGRLPRMPMQMKKMGLNRSKFLAWTAANEEYLATKEAEYRHKLRYFRNELPKYLAQRKVTDPMLMVLKMMSYDNGIYLRRKHFARVRSPTSPEGGTYSKSDIKMLLESQEHSCRYCAVSFAEASFTIDHIVPVTLGGLNEVSNLQLVCKSCNSSKSNGSHERFMKSIKLLIVREKRARSRIFGQ